MKEPKCLSLSYEQITELGPEMLEPLQGMLDDETLARCAHLGRFFSRVCELGEREGVMDKRIGDVLTDEKLDAIFRDTADARGAQNGGAS